MHLSLLHHITHFHTSPLHPLSYSTITNTDNQSVQIQSPSTDNSPIRESRPYVSFIQVPFLSRCGRGRGFKRDPAKCHGRGGEGVALGRRERRVGEAAICVCVAGERGKDGCGLREMGRGHCGVVREMGDDAEEFLEYSNVIKMWWSKF